MYNCSVCRVTSQPGEARKVHVVTRQRVAPNRGTEIVAEYPICRFCDHEIKNGESFAKLVHAYKDYEPMKVQPTPLPKPKLSAEPKAPMKGIASVKAKLMCKCTKCKKLTPHDNSSSPPYCTVCGELYGQDGERNPKPSRGRKGVNSGRQGLGPNANKT